MTTMAAAAPVATPIPTAPRVSASDAWAAEVLQGCARARYTPDQGLLGMLAPPRPTPNAEAATVTTTTATAIDVDAEVDDETARNGTEDNSFRSGPGAYQPYLRPIDRATPSAEEQALRAALSPTVLRKAYRMQAPCMTKHTTKQERRLNCTASPRCMAGLQMLGTDAATREDCLVALMGDGPYVLPLPPSSTATSTTAAPAASSSAQQRAQDGKASKTFCDPTSQLPLAECDGMTVAHDASFPCLWRGVRNLMNTCYFNAIVQLVFSIARVRRAILHDGAGASQLAESGLKELFALMAFSREGGGADPKSFASYLSLDVKVQQDAQEFFTLLLDWLRCHCGPVVQAAVTSTFSGTLLYDRKCGACGRSAKRAEPFLYLSLPVRPTLEDSLSEFSKPEAVDGFMCEKCGKTAVATSRQYMRTLPDVLVVHWNRFEFDLHTLQRHKVTTATSFPLVLDMATYMRQWYEQKRHSAAAAAANGGATGAAPAAPTAMAEEDETLQLHHLYELRGVVNHLGDTAVSGHYTYHGKISQTTAATTTTAAEPGAAAGPVGSGSAWLNFNDAEVSRLNRYQGQRGSSPDAYLLVYHRIPQPPQSSAISSTTTPSTTTTATGASPAPTAASPSPAEYPAYLRQYVDRVNEGCLAKRREWVEQRAQVGALFDVWAAAAKAVFESATTAAAAPAWISTAAAAHSATPSLYVLPTHWLQQLGRFFLPAYIDAAALGGGGEALWKRNKKDTDSATDLTPASPATAGAVTGTGNGSAAESGLGNDAEEGSGVVEGTVVRGPIGPLRHGHVQTVREVQLQVRQHALLQAMASITCPHGYVSPWGSYKAVPATAFTKLSRFLDVCGAALAAASTNGAAATSATAAATDATSSYAFTDANLCAQCVAAMAAGVQMVATRVAEDEEAELALTKAWREAEARKAQGGSGDAELDSNAATNAAGGGGGSTTTSAGPATAAAPQGKTGLWRARGAPRESEEARKPQEPQHVLVSEAVVEAWASFYCSQLRWSRVRQTQGNTGVLVMQEARVAPPPLPTPPSTSPASQPPPTLSSAALTSAAPSSAPASALTSNTAVAAAAAAAAATTTQTTPAPVPDTVSTTLVEAGEPFSLSSLNIDGGDLNLSAQLLCPHGALRPGQHTVVIPASLRRYWVHRFVEVLTTAQRAGLLRAANAGWSVDVKVMEHSLLPLIPASTTSTTCQECMRSSVQQITSRNHQRMKRIEERKRFPSLWLAGAMTSPTGIAQLLPATGAENEEQLLAAMHPNRLFFKQSGERDYRDYVKRWAESHAQQVAQQTAEVQRLRTTLEKKKQHDAAWNARVTQRRSGGRGRGNTAASTAATQPTSVLAASPPASPPDPKTLEGRLYLAEEALEKLKTEAAPDHTVAYGCVPTWWVARWYAAMQDEDKKGAPADSEDADGGDAALLALPRISFNKLKCHHAQSLLEVPWLNPSDGFWQGTRAKRAEVLWNGVQVERAGPSPGEATAAGDAASTTPTPSGPTAAEYRSQCWLPPMAILPMDEYVALLTQYGEPGMLEHSAAPASATSAAALPESAGDTVEVTDVDAEAEAEQRQQQQQQRLHIASAERSPDGDTRSAAHSPPPAAQGPAQAVFLPTNRLRALPGVPVEDAVMLVRFHNGARQLVPSPCPDCCAAMLADFDVNCESFVNGSLKLNLHIKKSRKNFYDAMSVLTSAAVQQLQVGGSNDPAAGKQHTPDGETIPAGVHHYTTLRQLRLYISAHLREKHGYLVPPEVLQIGRAKSKPLKRRSPLPQQVQQQHPSGGDAGGNYDAASLEEATLQELGIRDGETLSVQSVDLIAQTCATAAAPDEEWEAIPPELLHAGAGGAGSGGSGGGDKRAAPFQEQTAAFRETRLQGSHGGVMSAASAAVTGTVAALSGQGTGTAASAAAASAAAVAAASAGDGATSSAAGPAMGVVAGGPAEEQGVACPVCTFLNASGMVVCEMCEAPLPRS